MGAVPSLRDACVLRSSLLSLLLLVPIGCAGFRQEAMLPPAGPMAGERGFIFVADGAGNYQATSIALRQALVESCIPLRVVTAEWSHGYRRILLDQIDYAHAREEGERLACEVAAVSRCCPGQEIYLLGHSAGSAVVLAAIEALPPNTVDRIVLLAPSVSAAYDLRPALMRVRSGIDVYYSERDVGVRLSTGLVGTADRQRTAPAGYTGFWPTVACPGDALLYSKLRQHAWHPCVAWTGNQGRHNDSHTIDYLKAYVLPLLQRCS